MASLDRMYGCLCIFPARTRIPLHVILRYWFEIGAVVPNIAKRLLAAMAEADMLTVVGDMKYEKPQPEVGLVPGPPASGRRTIRSEKSKATESVSSMVSFYQTKLNAYIVEQEKYEKASQNRLAAGPGLGDDVDPGMKFTIDTTDPQQRGGARTRQQQKQVAAATAKREVKEASEFDPHAQGHRVELVSLLTGYDEEEDDVRIAIVLSDAQRTRAQELLKGDALVWFGPWEQKGRSYASTAARDPKEVLALRDGGAAANDDDDLAAVCVSGQITVNTYTRTSPRPMKNMSVTERVQGVLDGTLHILSRWKDVVAAEPGFNTLSLRAVRARARHGAYTFVPKDMGVPLATAREVVSHKQHSGHHDLHGIPVKSKPAAIQRLHAALVDAWGRVLPGAYQWHRGPDDGWFHEHLPAHLAAATLPEPVSPEFYIARGLVRHTMTHTDFGLVSTVFPYPSSRRTRGGRQRSPKMPPAGGAGRLAMQAVGDAARSASTAGSAGRRSFGGSTQAGDDASDACDSPGGGGGRGGRGRGHGRGGSPECEREPVHLTLQETYSATIVADALKQIHEHPLVEGLGTPDIEPKVLTLALIAPEARMRVSFSTILRQCEGSYFIHLLVAQMCAALAERNAAWYRGTWMAPAVAHLIKVKRAESGGAAISEETAIPKPEELLTTILDIVPEGVHRRVVAPSVELLRALLYFCETHPSLKIRSRCGDLLRSCCCEELVTLLVFRLHDAAVADPRQIRAVWPDGDAAPDEIQVGSVSGKVGAEVITAFGAFPVLAGIIDELARVREDLVTVIDGEDPVKLKQLAARAYTEHTDALVDKWFVPDETIGSAVAEGPPDVEDPRREEIADPFAAADAGLLQVTDPASRRASSRAGNRSRAVSSAGSVMSGVGGDGSAAATARDAAREIDNSSPFGTFPSQHALQHNPQSDPGKKQRTRLLSKPTAEPFQVCQMRLIDFINRRDLWQFEAFCALQKVAEEPGGRAARVMCNCLLKLWGRWRAAEAVHFAKAAADAEEAGTAGGTDPTQLPPLDSGAFDWCEEAADVLHLVRDCLAYADSDGLRACVRAVPQPVFADRGLISALLQIGFKHEAEPVRHELAARFVHIPPRHWDWMAMQLGLALDRFAYTPFMISQILSSCPSIPARPPENLLELALSQVKIGCPHSRRLLKRSPSLAVTSAMADALGEAWVTESLPSLGPGAADALIDGLTADMTYLKLPEIRASCRTGDNRVGERLARLLSETTDLEDSVLIIQALPSFKVLGSGVIGALFEIARSDHPVAEQLQQLLSFGAVTVVPAHTPRGNRASAAAAGGGNANANDDVDDMARVENDSVRVPIVNELVAEGLEDVLLLLGEVPWGDILDIENPIALQGILSCAPPAFLYSFKDHACMKTLLRLTWCCDDYECRCAAQSLFARCQGGWATLIAHLSPVMIAHAQQDHVLESDEEDEEDAVSRAVSMDYVTDDHVIRVIQAMPSDANNVEDRVLDIIIAYAFEHQNEDVSEACQDFIWGCAVPGKLFDKFEKIIETDDKRLLRAVELLPRNLARAGESLLSRLLVIGASHHDPTTRETTQDLLRANQSASTSLPSLVHAHLKGQEQDYIGVLRCIDGATLPPILLSTICALILHMDKEVSDTAYDEVSKVKSARADIVPVLMKCVDVALEPRLVGVPEEVCRALSRHLALFRKWGLSNALEEDDVVKLLKIASTLPGTEHEDLALELVRKADPAHGKVCLKMLIAAHGYTKPELIARGLPELPDKAAAIHAGISVWEYDNLLKSIVPRVLDGDAAWAVALTRRSRVLWPIMAGYIRAGVFKLSNITNLRNAALDRAAKAMASLPSLRALCVGGRDGDGPGGVHSGIDAGKLMDAICLLADGDGEDDIVAALREPARQLVLAGVDDA